MPDDRRIRAFVTEAEELLVKASQALVSLESEPDSDELLEETFRHFHTIKGNCGFFGFGNLQSITHSAENLLTLLRNDHIEVSDDVIDALLETVDAGHTILEHIEEHGDEPDDSWGHLIADLERLQRVSSPPADKDAAEPAPSETQEDSDDSKPVSDDTDDAQQTSPSSDATRSESTSPTLEPTGGTVRVDVELLDDLMNQMSELILSRNQLQRQAEDQPRSAQYQTAFRQLGIVTTQLQQTVMEARMQPIRRIWRRYPRLIRDLGREHGKQIQLVTEGGDTELDKNLVESISDPITHLVRNSVAHGIETPEEREAAGKPPTGTITLEASQQRGRVVVRVSDDGRGIDRESVKRQAVELGLASSAELEDVSDEHLYEFLFHPGFSTTETTTNTSGRGVGLEVVKQNLDEAGGTVHVDSMPNEGTTFELQLPLTLAVVSALTIECRGQEFVLPQGNVLRLVGPSVKETADDLDYLHETPVYRLDDQLLPVVFFDRLLGFDDRTPKERLETESDDQLVLIEANRTRFALAVDRVRDTEERVVKSLSTPLEEIGIYTGATLRGDGQPVMILDPAGIVSRADISLDEDDARVNRKKRRKPDSEEPEDQEREEILWCRSRDDGRIAVPLQSVERLIEIAEEEIERRGEVGFAHYKEGLLPLVSVEDVLPERRSEPRNEEIYRQALRQENHPVIVYDWNGRRVGLVMTEFLEVLETDLGEQFGVSRPGVAFCTDIADEITEVLDIQTILEDSPLNPRNTPSD